MAQGQRAKQFAPFAALTGLEAALEAKRIELGLEERRWLSEEETQQINAQLAQVNKGDAVRITYYQMGATQTLTGTVTENDALTQRLRVNGQWVAYEDLYGVTREE